MAALLASLPPNQAQAALQQLLNGPAGIPPAGVIPNFDEPRYFDRYVILTIVMCLSVTTTVFSIRMYTKALIIRSITLEDYLITVAWLGELGMTAPTILVMTHGGGGHIWNLQLKTLYRMLYFTNVWTIVYAPIIFLVKLSILQQYLKIFVPHRRSNMGLFIAIYVTIGSCFVFYVVSTAFQIFMCHPRKAFWQPGLGTGHCYDYYASYKASGIFNVVSDSTILLLPMVPLWRLKTSLSKRLLIMGIFGTGIFACVASFLRTFYTWKITYTPDVTYYTMLIGLWTDAEIATGILVCCLPVTPRFFQHFGPRISKTFSFVSKSFSRSGKKAGSKDSGSKRNGWSFHKQTTLKKSLGLNSFPETWTVRASNPHARPNDYIIKLDDFSDTTVPLKTHHPTTRNDLEHGHEDHAI